jgi:hypothetical protein
VSRGSETDGVVCVREVDRPDSSTLAGGCGALIGSSSAWTWDRTETLTELMQMPLTVPILLFALIGVTLAAAAWLRRSRRLAVMAGAVLVIVLVFVAVAAVGISRM